MKYQEMVEDYFKTKTALNTFSKATVQNRTFTLKEFVAFLEKEKVLSFDRVHKNILLKYFAEKNVSNNTKRTIYFVLMDFFEYLLELGVIEENVLATIPLPPERHIEADYLNQEELEIFFDSLLKVSQERFVDRNLLIAALLCSLCVRVSELSNLKVDDISLTQKTIRITRKGGSQAVLPFNDEIMEYLENWLAIRIEYEKVPTPWLFLSRTGGKLSTRQIQAIIRKALEGAGLYKQNMGPHLLRHSGASLYLASGVNIKTIQTLLGHSNISTTSKYVHASESDLRDAVNAFKGF